MGKLSEVATSGRERLPVCTSVCGCLHVGKQRDATTLHLTETQSKQAGSRRCLKFCLSWGQYTSSGKKHACLLLSIHFQCLVFCHLRGCVNKTNQLPIWEAVPWRHYSPLASSSFGAKSPGRGAYSLKTTPINGALSAPTRTYKQRALPRTTQRTARCLYFVLYVLTVRALCMLCVSS